MFKRMKFWLVASCLVISVSSLASVTYQPSENEIKIIKLLIEGDVTGYFNGGGNIIEKSIPEKDRFIVVSANKIQADYSANEARGDNNYKGRALIISGVVSKIGSGIGDKPYVILRAKNQFSSPRLDFEKKYQGLTIDLNKGDKVSFICMGNGSIMGSPSLKGCVPTETVKADLINKLYSGVDTFVKGQYSNKYIAEFVLAVKIGAIRSNDYKDCKAINIACFTKVLQEGLTEEEKALAGEYKKLFQI